MSRRLVNGEAVPDFSGHFVSKDIAQRLAAPGDILVRETHHIGFAGVNGHVIDASGEEWGVVCHRYNLGWCLSLGQAVPPNARHDSLPGCRSGVNAVARQDAAHRVDRLVRREAVDAWAQRLMELRAMRGQL